MDPERAAVSAAKKARTTEMRVVLETRKMSSADSMEAAVKKDRRNISTDIINSFMHFIHS
jgi:hypothetical protein